MQSTQISQSTLLWAILISHFFSFSQEYKTFLMKSQNNEFHVVKSYQIKTF